MLHGTTLINGRSRRLSHPVTRMGRAARRRRLGDGPLPCDPAGSHPFPPRLRRTLRQILLIIAFDVLYFTTDPAVVKRLKGLSSKKNNDPALRKKSCPAPSKALAIRGREPYNISSV